MDPFVPVHASPAPDDGGVMPCCGRTPFEKGDDRITTDPTLVTCGKKAWLRVDNPDVAISVLDIAGVKAERADLADFNNRIVVVRIPEDEDPEGWIEGMELMQEDLAKRGSQMMVVQCDDFEIGALSEVDLALMGLQRIPEGN